MNKKGKDSKKYDDKEDLEITKVAKGSENSQMLLFVVLIFLFGLTLFASLTFIGSYYINKNKQYVNTEYINIDKNKNHVLITNNGKISMALKESDLDTSGEKVIIEKYTAIELKTDRDAKEDGKIKYSVRYNIEENDYDKNVIATNYSDYLVRFAYSYDNNEWIYVNNAISNMNNTLTPLMGNYYDVAGITGPLNVVSKYELSVNPGKSKKMYWKSETIINKNADNIDKAVRAEFKITYDE